MRTRRIFSSSSRIVHRPLPIDDPKIRQPDISLAKRTLDWTPRVGLTEGLRKTIGDFRRRLGMGTR